MPARGQHFRHALGEHIAHAVQADIGVVAGAELRFGDQLAVAVHQREAGLGSSAVDAEEIRRRSFHAVSRAGRPARRDSRCLPCWGCRETARAYAIDGRHRAGRSRHRARAARRRRPRSCRAPAGCRAPHRGAARVVISMTRAARPSRRSSSSRSWSYLRVSGSLETNTSTSVRSLMNVLGPWRKPSGVSKQVATAPLVSSPSLSVASRARLWNGPLPRYTTRSKLLRASSCRDGSGFLDDAPHGLRNRADAAVEGARLAERVQRRVHHAAEAGGHREAHVVSFLGQQQRLRLANLRAAQRAFGVAGDDQVAHVLHQRLGQRDGLQALGAVAGAAERHQQQGLIGIQVQVRATDDVGGRHGVDARGQLPVQHRRQALPDVGRRARAREDDARQRIVGHRCDESLQLGVQAG